MRKINENDYDYFTIAASWGNVTLHSLKSALKDGTTPKTAHSTASSPTEPGRSLTRNKTFGRYDN